MLKVNFYELNLVEDSKLQFAVIVSKHKDRDTWEIPGGHREQNENIPAYSALFI